MAINVIRKQIMGIATLAVCVFIGGSGWANDITVSNVKRFNQAPGSHWLVRFDLAWANSWRCEPDEEPHNWDAAWVFMKFRTNVSENAWGDWKHASLSTNASAHIAPAGSTIEVGLDGRAGAWGTNGVGVFIYRNAPGSGQFSVGSVKLHWNSAADGVADSANIELKVCAIEMVYVPAGAFYAGNTNAIINGSFRSATTLTNPLYIPSEDEMTVYWNAGPTLSADLPNEYPKGCTAFYGMKHELTQGQYVDFLNTLTRNQQATRFVSTTVGDFVYTNAGQAWPTNRNGIQLVSDPGTPNPRGFADNLNTANAPNSSDDGQWIASNWLSWGDLTAYLDWAGLRPMTDTEFEKACRGTNAPAQGEYAWGASGIVAATNLMNGSWTNGMANEAPGNANANCNYLGAGAVGMPVRVGCFGIGAGTRQAAGAGYYGMLDLSGNLWECIVTVENATGRGFTGQHGNGVLSGSGNADVTLWPGTDAVGGGIRGGGFSSSDPAYFTVASRSGSGSSAEAARMKNVGGRGVRTAP